MKLDDQYLAALGSHAIPAEVMASLGCGELWIYAIQHPSSGWGSDRCADFILVKGARGSVRLSPSLCVDNPGGGRWMSMGFSVVDAIEVGGAGFVGMSWRLDSIDHCYEYSVISPYGESDIQAAIAYEFESKSGNFVVSVIETDGLLLHFGADACRYISEIDVHAQKRRIF